MRVIAKKRLRRFWAEHGDAEQALRAWYGEAKAASWGNTAQIKEQYGTASIINAERVVFNICGNKYRLVVWVNYEYRTVYVRFIGTHAEYDAIDAETV